MEVYFTEDSNSGKNEFDVHSFERKIVELVEELRFRRNLEIENEKTVKSCMEEKYKIEVEMDEQRAKHVSEKESLNQQISVLKRKLEDNVCVSDDEKLKQQIVNKTYSQELRTLKEELRKAMTEKLGYIKQIQSLQAQLKLHKNYQENIMKQFTEIQQNSKKVSEEYEALKSVQKNVMDQINEVKEKTQKFNQYDNHLRQIISLIEEKNETLKKDLISCRSELTLNKHSTPSVTTITKSVTDFEKIQKRNSELEKLFLQSRKENAKTIENLVESNKQLCSFMNKYSDIQKTEKSLTVKVESYEKDITFFKEKLKKQEKLLAKKDNEAKKVTIEKIYKDVEIQTLYIDPPTEIPLLKNSLQSHVLCTNNSCQEKLTSKDAKGLNLDKDGELASVEGKNETLFNIQYEALTFSEISKRKHNYDIEKDDDECMLPKKKNCSENNGTDQTKNKSVIRFNLEHDKSLPSSLNSSQESTTYFANSESKDERHDGGIHSQKTTNDAEIKELMSVEEDLQNLQVLDKETNVPTNFFD